MNHQLKFKNMRTGDKVFDIVNYTLLTLIMVIVLYPVLYIVAASFSDPQAVVSGEVFILPVRPTLRGYEAVFKNKKILTGFANSVYYLVVGTLLNLVMTMLCAYPLSRKEFRARGGIAMFFVFTMYFSGGLVPSDRRRSPRSLPRAGCLPEKSLSRCPVFPERLLLPEAPYKYSPLPWGFHLPKVLSLSFPPVFLISRSGFSRSSLHYSRTFFQTQFQKNTFIFIHSYHTCMNYTIYLILLF